MTALNSTGDADLMMARLYSVLTTLLTSDDQETVLCTHYTTSDERNFALTIELMERIVGSRSSVMLLGFGY